MHIIKDKEIEGKVNVLGKTFVVHERLNRDSLGSGRRLCCGRIWVVGGEGEDSAAGEVEASVDERENSTDNQNENGEGASNGEGQDDGQGQGDDGEKAE